MVSGFSIGYTNFTVFLLLLSGGLILWIDVKGYTKIEMQKEIKASRIMGWMNLGLAAVVYIANWFYERML